jgi:hypothetical protein
LMKIAIFHRLKPGLIVVGWATSMAAITVGTIFEGLLLPKVIGAGGGLLPEVINASPFGLWIFYLGNFMVCVVAAMVISDLGSVIVSFFPAFLGAALITYLVLALPDLLGIFPFPGLLQESAIIFTFGAFFPVLLIVALAGTLLGVGLAEHFL